MIQRLIWGAFIALAGCTQAPPPAPIALADVPPPVFTDGQIETDANGRCFTLDPGPERFRTVPIQTEVVPERRNPDGTLINEAIFRNETRQVKIENEAPVKFETICPPQYTALFTSSLQRALAARGAFSGAITGQLDAPTRAAVQAFQTPNSPFLSVDVAKSLGLISVE